MCKLFGGCVVSVVRLGTDYFTVSLVDIQPSLAFEFHGLLPPLPRCANRGISMYLSPSLGLSLLEPRQTEPPGR